MGILDAPGVTKNVADARYVAKRNLVFNVRDEGALGDGTTDDTTAINAAYTKARSVRGTVLFPASVNPYIVSAVVDPNGTTTTGYGATLKTKNGTTPQYAMFQTAASSGFTILGLTIDVNKANTTTTSNQMGIYVYSPTGTPWSSVTLRDVTVINSPYQGINLTSGVPITDGLNAPVTPTTLSNVRVSNCQWGIWLAQMGDVTLDNCNSSGNVSYGIYDYLSLRTKITGCVANTNGGHGIVSQYGYGTTVANCVSVGNTGGGIVIGGGLDANTESSRYRITGCLCKSNTGSGIVIDPTKVTNTGPVASYGVISGNVCTLNSLHGIVLTNPKYVTVIGNLCDAHTSAGYSGISVQGSSIAVTGNTCAGNSVGISSYGSNGDNYITGNMAIGNTTAQYVWDATVPNSPVDYAGLGVPTLAAPVGSTYRRGDGGAGATFYVKETGVASTVWVAK